MKRVKNAYERNYENIELFAQIPSRSSHTKWPLSSVDISGI
jgi:hypothetical protein